MKRAALLLGCGLAIAPAASWAQEACSSIIATGNPDYTPVGYLEAGTIAGVGALLVTEIATELGVPVDIRDFGNWEEAQAAARSGAADLIFGVYYTDERSTYLTYVDVPFMLDPVGVFVRAGEGFALEGWDDLRGLRGVTSIGESYGVAFDAYIAAELTVDRVVGNDAVYAALLAGEADYAIIGMYPGQARARELGLGDRVEMLTPVLLEENFYVAFSSASPCRTLVDAFAAAIAERVESGHVAELIATVTAAWETTHVPAR